MAIGIATTFVDFFFSVRTCSSNIGQSGEPEPVKYILGRLLVEVRGLGHAFEDEMTANIHVG